MKLIPLKIILAVVLGAVLAGSVQSQPVANPAPGGELVVATRAIAPFVVRANGGELTGFSIDLWQAVAAEMGMKTRFVQYETLPELLDSVRSGRNPAGISAISITSDRAATMDFSQPMFRSGLAIMVRNEDGAVDVLSVLFSKTMLIVLGLLALVILVPAHIFWWIARGRDEGLPIREPYIPGIFDAIFWCAESMGGAAQDYPRRWFPRIVALLWLYAGLMFISYFTAFATTSLTLNSLRGQINSPDDLAGKSVAVVKGSTGAGYTTGVRARVTEYASFEECANALIGGRVDAVIYDAPVIQHYVMKEGRVRAAGEKFKPENYGIAFPLGSALRKPVNEALLKIMESGHYDSLMRLWLGEEARS